MPVLPAAPPAGEPAEAAAAPEPPSAYALLGPLEIRVAGANMTPRAYKLRVILAVLLVQANRTVSVDTLIDAVWGGAPPRTALQALRVYVSQLRRTLRNCPHAELTTRAPGYRLEADTAAIDTHRFAVLRADGLEAERDGDLPRAHRLYSTALALRRGDALADVKESYFLHSTALRLDEQWMSTLQRRIDIDLRTGGSPDLVAELQELCDTYPLDEGLHARLMIGLSRAGRTKEALDVHASLRDTFIAQLGIEPHRMLGDVQQAILASDHAALERLQALAAP